MAFKKKSGKSYRGGKRRGGRRIRRYGMGRGGIRL